VPLTLKQLRALVKSFPWDEWNQALAPGLSQVYRDLVEVAGQDVAKAHGVTFRQDDPFLQQHMTAYVGERIVQLSRTSRQDVIMTIRRALRDAGDLTASNLQDRILDAVRAKYQSYETYRALRIARSESAIAYNHGNVLGASQAGFDQVEVIDGTEWDEECREANGQIWTIQQALANPIQHPNCERAFVPHVLED